MESGAKRVSTGPSYIFITGGVLSSIGKGITTAALGALLRARGFSVLLRKMDPYLNVDPGTISPQQHGEVFVTDDGAETDLDLGHYERFTGVPASRDDCCTTGRFYQNLIHKERRGDYLGQTIQIIPHITDEIKRAIKSNTDHVDFVICEIGGTVGDIEGLPFLEAIRQIRNEEGIERSLFIHLAWIVYLEVVHEVKTKPAQHSVKELQRAGIQPDLLVCRSDHPLPLETRQKLGLFCNMAPENVIEGRNVRNIYETPIVYHQAGLDTRVCAHFGVGEKKACLKAWNRIFENIAQPKDCVTIGVVGKYMGLPDAYRSLREALIHGGIANQLQTKIVMIDSEQIENDASCKDLLKSCDGILVPGGFGKRGIEGKIRAIRYAREQGIPFLGICLGFQLAVIEAARSLAGLDRANSSEFCETDQSVVGLLEEWMDHKSLSCVRASNDMGGTMRLGSQKCFLSEGSLIASIYQSCEIAERHRHRYEVNLNYRQCLESNGAVFSGVSADGRLAEVMERKDHPWFVSVQFHPEFKSRPFEPHPLFVAFVRASYAQKQSHGTQPVAHVL